MICATCQPLKCQDQGFPFRTLHCDKTIIVVLFNRFNVDLFQSVAYYRNHQCLFEHHLKCQSNAVIGTFISFIKNVKLVVCTMALYTKTEEKSENHSTHVGNDWRRCQNRISNIFNNMQRMQVWPVAWATSYSVRCPFMLYFSVGKSQLLFWQCITWILISKDQTRVAFCCQLGAHVCTIVLSSFCKVRKVCDSG